MPFNLSTYCCVCQDFTWPVEGFLLPYAPPVKRASQKKAVTTGNKKKLAIGFKTLCLIMITLFFLQCTCITIPQKETNL